MMKTTAIVLAAGRGKRMQSDIPKQYLEILHKPVLYYSLKAFEDSCVNEIILVTSSEEIVYCQREIVDKFGFKKVTAIIAGGRERYESVYNGLLAAKDTDYVQIHDGARPFITAEEIDELSSAVLTYGACVAGMPVKDTIKISDETNKVAKTPQRDKVWLVQTPQVFLYPLIRNAYDCLMAAEHKEVTDDAMVLETFGSHPVQLVKTSYRNIKITTPEDILVAEALMR